MGKNGVAPAAEECMTSAAVLFDLDGTLLDSIADIAACMNTVLRELHRPVHDVETYKRLVGDGMEALVERALPPEAAAERPLVGERFRAEYGRRWAEYTLPYAGIPELLAELTRRGLALAVLSNKAHDFTCEMVRHFFPGVAFRAVCGARAGLPKKPDPAPALALAADLGLPPDRFLYLGDSGVDMLTARRAGMTAVGVLWGYRDEQELRHTGAHHLLPHPLSLLDLLPR